MTLVILVYQFCKELPPDEKYGLQSQLKRCSVSIPSNIAEGKMRSTKKDFIYFLRNALGSSAELETHLLLSEKLFTLSVNQMLIVNTEVQKMLFTLINKLTPNT